MPRVASTAGGWRTAGARRELTMCSTSWRSLRRPQRCSSVTTRLEVSRAPGVGVGAAARTVWVALCSRFAKRLQRLRIELQQDRPEPVRGLLHRPDHFLVLTGQRRDRPALLADRRQRPMAVGVGPQDVRQDQRVANVGLLARLAMPLSVASHRQRIDRKDREPCGLQRDH
jgi:hypothetical protein